MLYIYVMYICIYFGDHVFHTVIFMTLCNNNYASNMHAVGCQHLIVQRNHQQGIEWWWLEVSAGSTTSPSIATSCLGHCVHDYSRQLDLRSSQPVSLVKCIL